MSKHINVNPGQYTDGGRERQGEAVVHEAERGEYERTRHDEAHADRGPHIPNQERAGRPSSPAEEPQADETPVLSDDQGMID